MSSGGLFSTILGNPGDKLQIWFTGYRKTLFAGTGTALAIAYIQYNIHTKTQLECENIKNRVVITNDQPIPQGCRVIDWRVELPEHVYKNMGIRK